MKVAKVASFGRDDTRRPSIRSRPSPLLHRSTIGVASRYLCLNLTASRLVVLFHHIRPNLPELDYMCECWLEKPPLIHVIQGSVEVSSLLRIV
jgi:hypothetical protein